MRPTKFDVDIVRDLISDSTVGFGVPAFNEGDGILPTLESLWEGLSKLRLTASQLILSESYDQVALSSAQPAFEWARSVGAKLEIDSRDQRRSAKEALNIVFARARSDVLILVDADVLVPVQSLAAMLHCLFATPRPIAAIGATLPDPTFGGMRHRAGAWQLRAVTRATSLAPRSITGPNSFRAEAAFCGAWRDFYSAYRFPIGSGSISDSVELSRALVSGGYPSLNVAEAFVYKVPAGSLIDLCSGTVRSRVSNPEHRRRGNEYAAAIIEAARDPFGALLYTFARFWCWRNRGRLLNDADSEQWQMGTTTKRRTMNH